MVEESHHPPRKKSWQESFVRQHHNKLVLQTSLIPLAPIILVLIEAIIWPGLTYCTETSCPSRDDPYIPDVALIVIAFSIYTYCTFWGIVILLSSGAWMANAFWSKVIVIFSLFLMFCSCFQLVPPVVYRNFVLPYKAVQNYEFNVTRESENTATLVVQNFWSSYYTDPNVMVQVVQVSGKEQDPRDVSPTSTILQQDEQFGQTTNLALGVNITREINGLVDGNWYMWLVIPTHRGINGDAYPSRYIVIANSVTLSNGISFDRVAIDVRGFKLCQWSQDIGCEAAGAIH